MRISRILAGLAATAALMLVPTAAQAAILHANGGAGAHGDFLSWTVDFDDVANTVTVNATHTVTATGLPAPDPQVAAINLELSNGQQINLDLLTGDLTPGGFFTVAGNMLNAGPQTRTGTRLRVGSGRAAAISFSTDYVPPAT